MPNMPTRSLHGSTPKSGRLADKIHGAFFPPPVKEELPEEEKERDDVGDSAPSRLLQHPGPPPSMEDEDYEANLSKWNEKMQDFQYRGLRGGLGGGPYFLSHAPVKHTNHLPPEALREAGGLSPKGSTLDAREHSRDSELSAWRSADSGTGTGAGIVGEGYQYDVDPIEGSVHLASSGSDALPEGPSSLGEAAKRSVLLKRMAAEDDNVFGACQPYWAIKGWRKVSPGATMTGAVLGKYVENKLYDPARVAAARKAARERYEATRGK